MPGTVPPTASAAATAAGKVRVVTDVFDLEISLRGGDFVRADLLKYPQVKGEQARVRLFDSNPEQEGW